MLRQPPAYSPISLGALIRGAGSLSANSDRAVERLTEELCVRFVAERALLTSGGTHALQTVLSILGRNPDEAVVALPGYSCFDLVTAAVGARIKVRFYDVDPVTLCPDLDSVRRVLGEGVSTLVAANLYGFPLDFEAVRAECRAAGVLIVEDAAQGIGSRSESGDSGSLGDATIISFGRGKGWTGGGGGALLLRASATALADDSYSGHSADGRGARPALSSLVAWALGRPSLYWIPASIPVLGLGETRYHNPTEPRGITAFSAALAAQTAEAAQDAASGRRKVAARWSALLEGDVGQSAGIRPCEPAGGLDQASGLRCPVVASSAARAAALVHSTRVLGVERGYPIPLHKLSQSPIAPGHDTSKLRGSVELAERLLTLPTHRWVGPRTFSAFDRAIRV